MLAWVTVLQVRGDYRGTEQKTGPADSRPSGNKGGELTLCGKWEEPPLLLLPLPSRPSITHYAT